MIENFLLLKTLFQDIVNSQTEWVDIHQVRVLYVPKSVNFFEKSNSYVILIFPYTVSLVYVIRIVNGNIKRVDRKISNHKTRFRSYLFFFKIHLYLQVAHVHGILLDSWL